MALIKDLAEDFGIALIVGLALLAFQLVMGDTSLFPKDRDDNEPTE